MESRIYFVQGEGGGPIKIGFSTDITARLKSMQTGSPVTLVLLAHFPGDIATEFEAHERFAAHRLNGEWFAPHEDILREIAAILEQVDQTVPMPQPLEPKTQDRIDRDERQRRFMSETLASALPVAYHRAPGWHRQAARDAGVTERAARHWVDGDGIVPSLTSIINVCRRNTIMYFWWLSCTAACWLADEIGVSETEALQALLAQPSVPLKLWQTKNNKSLASLLRKTWRQYQALDNSMLVNSWTRRNGGKT